MTLSTRIALFCTLLAAPLLVAQEGPKFPVAGKEHEALKRFVGEWETDLETVVAPDQPAMKYKGTISSRMLGGFWVINETKIDMAGSPLHGIQTIGYDTKSKKYVGTWVDSMTDHLWKYTGTFDATGKILTLEADGPDFTGGDKLMKYQDIYEFKAPDHIIATSKMQTAEGKWVTFMTGHSRRKK